LASTIRKRPDPIHSRSLAKTRDGARFSIGNARLVSPSHSMTTGVRVAPRTFCPAPVWENSVASFESVLNEPRLMSTVLSTS
jgi:hypothetical protein